MKTIRYKNRLFLLACLGAMFLTACNDWLDVKPKTEEEADQLFDREEGFKSSLAGAYIALCQPGLYGRELTFNMMGMLGQEWGAGGGLDNSSSANFLFKRYRYEEIVTKPVIELIWSAMYTTVANANSLIEYADKKRSVFTGINYEIIKGEALALRAFIHFDLLRMYAPYVFGTDAATTPAIPYVTSTLPQITKQHSNQEVVDYILKDIEAALELLKADPILTGEDRSGIDDNYLANRQLHLNYYAVLGLKARVCLYAQRNQEALQAAETVIRAQQEKGIFPWVSNNDITSTNPAAKNRTFSTEHLFAFNTTRLVDYIKGYFKETQFPLLPRLELFDGANATDYRTQFFETDNGVGGVFSKFWQVDITSGVRAIRDRMPALRITEMYYIAAECYALNNPAQAMSLLNTVRHARGIDAESDLADLGYAEIENEILREYQREFLGEGQLFFYHKRKNTQFIATANAVYQFPLPDQEIDLGERDTTN